MSRFLTVLVFTALAAGCGARTELNLQVSGLLGRVEIVRTGTLVVPAAVGMRLGPADAVRTIGTNSRCDLALPSGSLIRVGGGAEFRLASLLADGQRKTEHSAFELEQGTVWLKVAKLGAHDRLEVRTRTAVVGVRGTQFSVGYTEGTGTSVQVKAGRVAVSLRPILPAALGPGTEQVKEEIRQLTEVSVGEGEQVNVSTNETAALGRKAARLAESVGAATNAAAIRDAVRRELAGTPAIRTGRIGAETKDDEFKRMPVVKGSSEASTRTRVQDRGRQRTADDKAREDSAQDDNAGRARDAEARRVEDRRIEDENRVRDADRE